jgi:hypothetical protein
LDRPGQAGTRYQATATPRGPRWLTYNRVTHRFEFNDHANTIRRIFALSLEGYGSAAIASILNRDGVQTPRRPQDKAVGRGGISKHWIDTSIWQTLTHPAAYGTWVPRSQKKALKSEPVESVDGVVTRYWIEREIKPAGEPVPHYYPAVVSQEIWKQAQASIKLRAKGGGNKGRMVNVLQGILFCAECGGHVQRNNQRGGIAAHKFECFGVRSGLCTVKSRPLSDRFVWPSWTGQSMPLTWWRATATPAAISSSTRSPSWNNCGMARS